MDDPKEYEIFKIGRTRIFFPQDITEDELQFMSMIIFSYIQNTRYKNSKDWSIKERLEVKKNEPQVGVS